jgi:hypothetical protein
MDLLESRPAGPRVRTRAMRSGPDGATDYFQNTRFSRIRPPLIPHDRAEFSREIPGIRDLEHRLNRVLR